MSFESKEITTSRGYEVSSQDKDGEVCVWLGDSFRDHIWFTREDAEAILRQFDKKDPQV